jgi:hypothetical protein
MARSSSIKKLLVLVLLSAAGHHSALAAPATSTGPAALALAAVVAEQAPLGRFQRRVIARLFDGNTAVVAFPNRKLTVTAASITCRVSNVDITSRSCELTFRTNKRTLHGRQANEIFATMATAGVTAEGAAGSLVESVSMLVCTLDLHEIRQKAGGGADCMFQTGP